MTQTTLETPFGPVTIVANDRAVVRIELGKRSATEVETALVRQAKRELCEYFAGTRTHFSFPVAPETGTELEREVWRALERIPLGETRSYADIARQIGSPRAVRAVGAANGKNPIAIVWPCHRVIGSDGSLRGYAGGLAVKRWLLEHEAAMSEAARHQGTGL